MDTIQQALKILHASEKDLRKLIELAVIERRYTDVAQLAEIAELLGKAISKCGTESISNDPKKKSFNFSNATTAPTEQIVVSDPPILGMASKQIRRQKTDEFPKFETERDRLVKIGWSKKDRKIYEHRASRDLALAVCQRLSELSDTSIFKMENVLPITLMDGSEVPLYQAYLILAWLRHLGFVKKQGKDGYQWAVGSFDKSAFDAAWDTTPSRA